MTQEARTMLPAAKWILTHRLPCAFVAVLMFGLPLWFAGTALSIPLLALHLLTPALFALITLGGGTMFAVQVAVLAAVLMSVAAHASLEPGLMLLTLYGLLPILAAASLNSAGGISRSAQHLALGLGTAMLAALIVGASSHDVTAREFVGQALSPLFGAMQGQREMDAVLLQRIRHITVWIFPGLMALSLWFAWWGNVLLARSIATYYGFFRGDMRPVSALGLDSKVAYLFLALAAVGAVAQGTVQYLAVNVDLLIAGLLSAQGLAVAHTWLQMRRMQMLAVL
ncbi:MAG: DUF2232 domain-containing protein, partial [Mariprofundaceae bacterium]|nr:DUF2232 domain-containing protein [Mariprofundaceae bacterium]